MQIEMSRKRASSGHRPAGAGSPTALIARHSLDAAVAGALAELLVDATGLQIGHLTALKPADVVQALLACVRGSVLDLRSLEESITHGGYEDPGCRFVLVAERLAPAAWEDLQSVCGTTFGELILPDMLGTNTGFAALSGLKSVRRVGMALESGRRSLDLLPLSGLSQSLHVDLRCREKVDLDILTGKGVAVTAHLLRGAHGDSTWASYSASGSGSLPHAIPPSDRATCRFVLRHRDGMRYRLTWNDAPLRAAGRQASEPQASRFMRLWRLLSQGVWGIEPPVGRRLPLAVVRDECFAALEDALSEVPLHSGEDAAHGVRSEALHILDHVHAGTLDLASSSAVGPRLIAMSHKGWAALERYCEARYGCPLQRILLPTRLEVFRNDSTFMVCLKQLRELKVVQFTGTPPVQFSAASR
jgi:hypothetical protein